jgi:3D-(3,5/4)-trihydroxycyclohexane-1,2-dione acylhydrolase (decyclizing)
MMANSELATAVMMGQKITVVVTDNRGFGCINRLQMATGSAEFNNLLDHSSHVNPSHIDFAAHAGAMGADTKKVGSIRELEEALAETRNSPRTTVVIIDTDPYPTPETGGWWWDVAVPEVSEREQVRAARKDYEAKLKERN